jgi:hypothetical protein
MPSGHRHVSKVPTPDILGARRQQRARMICCVDQSSRKPFLMLPHQVFYIVPVLLLSIFFGSFLRQYEKG